VFSLMANLLWLRLISVDTMAFIRKKTIKGNDYFYLVEGFRVGNKVRQRVLRYLGNGRRAQSLADRFWSRVNKNGPVPQLCPELGPCWLWTGSTNRGGYGRVTVAGRSLPATHVAWFLAYGTWIMHHACHHCDNPPCVNPGHLFDGDDAANQYDRVVKGLGGKPYFDSIHIFQ
jgi:hypothetical protein